MVELRTRKREMRRDGTNHYEKLGLQRILYASQFTKPNTAGTSPDLVCHNTDTRSSQSNQARRTPHLISTRILHIVLISIPISLIIIHNSTIIAERKVKSSLSISVWYNHELTQSTANTEFNIHWVLYTPCTAYPQECLSSLHSHDYELTPECSFSFRRASLYDRLLSASSPWELKGNVTLSHSHGCKRTNWWIECQHPAHRSSTASKY